MSGEAPNEKSKSGDGSQDGAPPSAADNEKSGSTKKEQPPKSTGPNEKSASGKDGGGAKTESGEPPAGEKEQQQPSQATSMELQNPDLMPSTTAADGAASPTNAGQSNESVQTSPSDESAGKSEKRSRRKKVDLTNVKIGILGTGKMAEALTIALTGQTGIDADRIWVGSSRPKMEKSFSNPKNVKTSKRLYDLFARIDCDVFFFAFHGHVIHKCIMDGGSRALALTTNYIPNMRHPIFFLSLMGGVQMDHLKLCLLNPERPEKSYKLKAHRIMLNLSIAHHAEMTIDGKTNKISYGVGAIDVEPDSSKCDPLVRNILSSMVEGNALERCDEKYMDVACVLAGCGLAIAYHFLGALADGGFKIGLPKNTAIRLAAKTLKSAADLVIQKDKAVEELRDQCLAPSGPAVHGLQKLKEKDAASGFAVAIEEAHKRIKQLAKEPRDK